MSSSKSIFNLSKMWRQLENNRSKGKQKNNYNSNSSSSNVSRQLANVIKNFKSKIKHADINGLLRISNQKEWNSLPLATRRKIIKERKKYIINSVKDGLYKMKNRTNIQLKLYNILNTDFINHNDYNTLTKIINKKFNLDAERNKILEERRNKKRELELEKLKHHILSARDFWRLNIPFFGKNIDNDMKKVIISQKPRILELLYNGLSSFAAYKRKHAYKFINRFSINFSGKNHYLFKNSDINKMKNEARSARERFDEKSPHE